MSPPAGSFADFFPSAPSVIQEKQNKKARLRQSSKQDSEDTPTDKALAANLSPEHRNGHHTEHSRASSCDKRKPVSVGEDKFSSAEGAGDLLNGLGSASSLASTVSSIFSNGVTGASLHTEHNTGSLALTPLTSHESSPPYQGYTPKASGARESRGTKQPADRPNTSLQSVQGSAETFDRVAVPIPSPVQVRPGAGEAKGIKIIYDPETDSSLAAKDKKKLKPRYLKFGEKEYSPPPDPRLAIPGYRSGSANIKLSGDAKTWKQRHRPAPYTVPPYAWDAKVSIGAGPTTTIVVFGFDPFTPESQIRALFGSYGSIAELENKTDLNTGTFLGVCSIRYKDSRPTRGVSILATDAAKRAEAEGHGQRIGTNTVTVETDRSGRKGKKIVERMTRRNEQKRARERQTELITRPSKVATPVPSESIATPPPNAPKGPSGKPSSKPPEGPRSMLPQKPSANLIEAEPVLSRIKRKPYVFISEAHVPVLGTTIPHLKKRMKMYDWREVTVDQLGYYIIFEDSKRGEDEALRCFQGSNNQALFTYTMVMECQQYGNPTYERSPSPERVLAEKQQKEEEERLRLEDERDIEEEKKQRAIDLDPVIAALEQVRTELRDKIMTDIRTRIAAPTLYDFLDPARHVAKRRKLNIADPAELSRPPNYLSFADDKASEPRPGVKKQLPFSSSISRLRKESSRPSGNAFMDERRQRPVKRRAEVRSLHQRLHDFYVEDESEDEHAGNQTRDMDSRPPSRHSSVAPGFDHEDGTPKRQHSLGRDDTPQEAESGDDNIGLAKSLLDPHLLKKEPEDMAPRELQLIINTLPPTSRLHKRAKTELLIRKKTRDDDRLFHIKTEEPEEHKLVEDAGLVPAETTADMLVESAELLPEAKAEKKSKSKKKSKKQLLKEREAAKVDAISAKALLTSVEVEVATPDVPLLDEIEEEKPVEEEEEEERAEVEWGVSTEAPRRTVEDDPDMVMDIDGWQYLLKDDEDLHFLNEALALQPAADLGDVSCWVSRQKEIKALNNGGNYGTTKETVQITGYYVPNASGSARTEGIKKILESEKSKYLPHRIKVAQARARREAAAKTEPLISAEAVRQAKLVSNAASRSNRANNRTHIKDINTVKQTLALVTDGAQSDAIRFNQLKKRKKLVKFDRSAIHGWGLYAEENIALGDMIIEYVGEKVRQAVANIRELRYDKQGMGSSYLFRIDEDTVVDATKRGGIARFINHSCAPNCTAKIIRVDGTKRIVIYALKEITKNDELTYDYKFDREMNDDDRIPCLCGSEVCKGFLN